MALEEYFDGFCYLEESEERMWPGRYVWVRAVGGKPDQSHLPPSAAPAEQSRAEQSRARCCEMQEHHRRGEGIRGLLAGGIYRKEKRS